MILQIIHFLKKKKTMAGNYYLMENQPMAGILMGRQSAGKDMECKRRGYLFRCRCEKKCAWSKVVILLQMKNMTILI